MDKKEKTVQSKLIYDGKVINVYEDVVKCPNGNIVKREIVKHHGGVCILAVIDEKIVLEKQYRYAYDEVLYELPAGKLEKGEDPKEAGIRELEEETGYKADDLISYGYMYPTCGYSNEIIYLYKATGLSKTKRHLDEDEFIDVVYIEKEKVKEMLLTNQIVDAKSVCLLSKYFLKEE